MTRIQTTTGHPDHYLIQPSPMHGLLSWSYDPVLAAGSKTPSAATIYLVKILVPQSITATNLLVSCVTAGTNYTNTQVALYNSAGTLLSQSAVLATGGTDTFASTGVKAIALAAAQSLVGSPTAFVWGALHMGTNAATAVVFGAVATGGITVNAGLAASTARSGSYTGHATNNLQTIGNLTPASIGIVAGTVNTPIWMGIT